MTANYIVAYANNSTNFEWKIINVHSGIYGFDNAVRHMNQLKSDFPNSALAIFSRGDNDIKHWEEKRPLRIWNEKVITKGLNPNGLISSAVSSIINSRESDWF